MQVSVVRICRKFQVGKDHRLSLVQSLAQSRVDYEVSNQAAQSLFQVFILKTPEAEEDTKISWLPTPTAQLSSW